MESWESRESMSRRQFLRGMLPDKEAAPVIDQAGCVGCGLCVSHCPHQALTMMRTGTGEGYQILFHRDRCDACSLCEKSCPEKCLTLEKGEKRERATKAEGTDKEPTVIFEDNISRCSGCGARLFPQALVSRLKSKIAKAGGTALPVDLCPACRMNIPFSGKESQHSRSI
jgi:ferredoxin